MIQGALGGLYSGERGRWPPSPKHHIPLSVTPYGSRNTPDMIKTTLRSMTNNRFWKTVLIPMHSTKLFVDP
jgi:hypothetical protein